MLTKFLQWWKLSRKVLRAVLRFLNLLEPDVPYMVLSLSKLSVWMTLALTTYVIVTGQGMVEVGASLIANVGAISNYAYRRKLQAETGTGAYGISRDSNPVADIPFEPEPMP